MYPGNAGADANLSVAEAKGLVQQVYSADQLDCLGHSMDAIASRETIVFRHPPRRTRSFYRTNNSTVETVNSQLAALFSETRAMRQRQVEFVLRCLGAERTSTGHVGTGGCVALACLALSLSISSQVKQCHWLLQSGQYKDAERLGSILHELTLI